MATLPPLSPQSRLLSPKPRHTNRRMCLCRTLLLLVPVLYLILSFFSQATAEQIVSQTLSLNEHHPNSHSFHVNQFTEFSMELLCSSAPWSSRRKPGLLLIHKVMPYVQQGTNITVSQGTPWLVMFEGSWPRVDRAGVPTNENDVWASGDFGRTWDLMAGVSLYGRSNTRVSSNQPDTFRARSGSMNCRDRVSDTVFSIGGSAYRSGVPPFEFPTNDVWYSTNSKNWVRQDSSLYTTFSPPRSLSSCDVDAAGHIFTVGGLQIPFDEEKSRLLNDVWTSSILGSFRSWKQVTDRAPWRARAQHVVLVGEVAALQKEVIWVIGGNVMWENNGNDVESTNDVWASSDSGQTWAPFNLDGGFGPRWGHSGVITKAGVLLIWGGASQDFDSYTDLWASFDGGLAWVPCNLPNDPQFIRADQGATLTDNEELIVVSGAFYPGRGRNRTETRDVWKTPFNLSDPTVLASMCGATVRPNRVGLMAWPVGKVPANQFQMQVLTRRAPWSKRSQPGLLIMQKPIIYTQVPTGVTVSTKPNWLLLYEGSVTVGDGVYRSNENDVWASADNGITWDLISGISRNGSTGYTQSAKPSSSFLPRAGSSNCEDPTNDDVYSVAGILYAGEESRYTNDVWYSSDALTWVQRSVRSFTPPRYASSCVIGTTSAIYVIGGAWRRAGAENDEFHNDVWVGQQQGRNWTLATGAAPFARRAQHLTLIHDDKPLQTNVIYVIGGLIGSFTDRTSINDVWASSDRGRTWVQITAHASWGNRWGLGGIIASNGVLAIMGGTDAEHDMSYKDLFVSLVGGSQWTQCSLPQDAGFIRGEQGVSLTAGDERLLLASGYTRAPGVARVDYADIWISNISMTDANRLVQQCAGLVIPSAGIGLRVWPGTTPPSSGDGGGMNAVVIVCIVIGAVVFVCISVFCWYSHKSTGRWPIISSLFERTGTINVSRSRGRGGGGGGALDGDYFGTSDKFQGFGHINSINDSSSTQADDHYQPPNLSRGSDGHSLLS